MLSRIFFIATGCLAFIYVLARAYTVNITYDEAWTLTTFVPQTIIHILNYTPCDANNHIINTLLIKLFYLTGTRSVFIARLPNVLAFLLYVFYAYKLAKEIFRPLAGILFFITVIANPFLIDFFSLARGYGLSLGFQMASLYYFILFTKRYTTKAAVYSLLFGMLAVLCNFSLLNYWLPALFIINLLSFFYNQKFEKAKIFTGSLLITGFLLLIIYEPIRKLKAGGNLYYGGNSSFYEDTLASLAKYMLYSPIITPAVYLYLNVFLVILVSGACILFVHSVKRNPDSIKLFTPLTAATFLLIISALLTIAQHNILGTFYLIDRTALFFYPLIILVLFYTYASISAIATKAILIIVTIFFGANFLKHANLYKTATWYFDAHTLYFLDYLNEQGKSLNKIVTIDFSWPFGSALAFYRQMNQYPYLQIVKNPEDREDLNKNAGYYIYLSSSQEKVGYNANTQKILNVKKDTIIRFSKEDVYLFKINK